MQLKMRYISAFLLCVYIVTVAALCFMKPSSLPQVELDFFGIPMDKVVHFIMFLPFSILAYMTFWPADAGKIRKMAVLLVIVIFGAGMAVATERIQALTGYRTGDIMDFAADMTGILTGAALTALFILLKKDREN